MMLVLGLWPWQGMVGDGRCGVATLLVLLWWLGGKQLDMPHIIRLAGMLLHTVHNRQRTNNTNNQTNMANELSGLPLFVQVPAQDPG